MNRIEKNEERFNTLFIISEKLDSVLTELEEHLDDFDKLNEYYGSKEWFKDKEEFEKGNIHDIRAGVLSEDLVWNLNEDFSDHISRMKEIIKYLEKDK